MYKRQILHNGKICISDEISQLISEEKLTVELNVGQHANAIQIIKDIPHVEFQSQNEEGYLQLALNEIKPADLNKLLVENGIPVTELIIKRTSLSGLFRKFTNEPAT